MVPGECLVKFKSAGPHALTVDAGELLNADRPFASAMVVGQSASISRVDVLNAAYHAISAEGLFIDRRGLSTMQAQLLQQTRDQQIRQRYPARARRAPPNAVLPDLTNWYVLHFDVPPGTDMGLVCQAYADASDEIEAAAPNYLAELHAIPNDTYADPDQNGTWSVGAWGQPYEDLWNLKQAGIEGAWKTTKGGGIVVGVVDTGVYIEHPDIAANIWTNPGEIAGNHVDDDHNGYVDDIHGWNFDNNTNNTDDTRGHGTHVAGTIAAIGNNAMGIVGASPDVKIMVLKGLGAGGGRSDALAKAIVYGADNGVEALNNSWGCTGCSSPAEEDAIKRAIGLGVPVIFSAGNSSLDASHDSPQNMHDPKVIDVSALDPSGRPTFFTNCGSVVDVGAPGGGQNAAMNPNDPSKPPIFEPYRNILSLKSLVTDPEIDGGGKLVVGGSYLRQGGTSMAAPLVTSIVAMLLAHNPTMTPEEVRQALRASTGPGDCGGPVNAEAALAVRSVLRVKIVSPPSASKLSIKTGTVTILGTAAGPSFKQYELAYAQGDQTHAGTWMRLGPPVTKAIEQGVLSMWTLQSVKAGPYELRLMATTTDGRLFEDRVDGVFEDDTTDTGAFTLTADPFSVSLGASSTLTWGNSITHVLPNSCLASGATDWTGAKPTSGTAKVKPDKTTTYFMKCFTPQGSIVREATVEVTPGTRYAIAASPDSVKPRATITGSWTATGKPDRLDLISLFAVSAPNSAMLTGWRSTAGKTSDTTRVAAPEPAGQYEFRVLRGSGPAAIVLGKSNAITVDGTLTNEPPRVKAWTDFQGFGTPPVDINLYSSVEDDGQPPGSSLSTTWSQIDGPGQVTFKDPRSTKTTATLPALGIYVVRVTASDTKRSTPGDVTITLRQKPVDDASQHAVSGAVAKPDGTGVKGLTMRLEDARTNPSAKIAETQTDDAGHYRLVADSNAICNLIPVTSDYLMDPPQVFVSFGYDSEWNFTAFPKTQRPKVAIISPTNGAQLPAGSDIPIVVNASDPDGTIAKVRFLEVQGFAEVPIGELSQASPSDPTRFSIIWHSPKEGGKHTLVAEATDTLGVPNQSDRVRITLIPSGFLVEGKVILTAGNGRGLAGATLRLGTSGISAMKEPNTTKTGADGSYQFASVPAGDYVISAQAPGYAMQPASQTVTVADAALTVAPFYATPPTLKASPEMLAPGDTITVDWTAPGPTNSSDWLALYAVKSADQFPVDGSRRPTGGAASGRVTITAPTAAGTYEARFLPAGGTVSVARSNFVTIGAKPQHKVRGRIVTINGVAMVKVPVRLSTNGISVASLNKIAMTDDSGQVVFDVPDGDYTLTPRAAGHAMEPQAQTAHVEGADVQLKFVGRPPTVTVSPSTAAPNAPVTVTWQLPTGMVMSANDVLVIVKAGSESRDVLNRRNIGGALLGTWPVAAPPGPGNYEAVYLFNGFTRVASASFQVSMPDPSAVPLTVIVTDAKSGQPVVDASVIVRIPGTTGQVERTGNDGFGAFALPANWIDQRIRLKVSMPGYQIYDSNDVPNEVIVVTRDMPPIRVSLQPLDSTEPQPPSQPQPCGPGGTPCPPAKDGGETPLHLLAQDALGRQIPQALCNPYGPSSGPNDPGPPQRTCKVGCDCEVRIPNEVFGDNDAGQFVLRAWAKGFADGRGEGSIAKNGADNTLVAVLTSLPAKLRVWVEAPWNPVGATVTVFNAQHEVVTTGTITKKNGNEEVNLLITIPQEAFPVDKQWLDLFVSARKGPAEVTNVQETAAERGKIVTVLLKGTVGGGKLNPPTFNPASRDFVGVVPVTMKSDHPRATVCYTFTTSKDNHPPAEPPNPVDCTTVSDPATHRGSILLVLQTTTIKAIAAHQGFTPSDIATATYVETSESPPAAPPTPTPTPSPVAPGPSISYQLSVDQNPVQQGTLVKLTWAASAPVRQTNKMGIYQPPSSLPVRSQLASSLGQASGTVTFLVDFAPGTYEARLMNLKEQLLASTPVTVSSKPSAPAFEFEPRRTNEYVVTEGGWIGVNLALQHHATGTFTLKPQLPNPALPGADFTTTSSSAQLLWSTKRGQARSEPYSFTVTAINGSDKAVTSFKIRIDPAPTPPTNPNPCLNAVGASSPCPPTPTPAPINHSPQAEDVTVSTSQDQAVAITLRGSDPDPSDRLTYAVGAASHGSLSGTAPNLTYTPAFQFSGTDQFAYSVNDGQATSRIATVRITVSVGPRPTPTPTPTPTPSPTPTPTPANQRPVAAFTATPSSGPARLTVAFNSMDSWDPDGRIVGYAWAFGDGGTSSQANPSHAYAAGRFTATLTVTDDGGSASLQPASHDITVDPASSTPPTPTPTPSPTPTPTPTPINHAPQAEDVTVSTSQDQAVAITLRGSDPDPSDQLTYNVGAASHGSLSGAAPNLTYTPAFQFSGTDQFTYSVSDGHATSRIATVRIAVSAVSQPTPTPTPTPTPAPTNQRPVAAFTATPSSGTAQLRVEFDGSGSSDPDGRIMDWVWDFGVAGSSRGSPTQTQTFPAGDHTVTLTVTDDQGAVSQPVKRSIHVDPAPVHHPPTASFTYTPNPASMEASVRVDFQGSSQADPGSQITGHAWDFGDGSSSSGRSDPTKTYTTGGTFTIAYTVTDNQGASSQPAKQQITIKDHAAPTASFTTSPTSGQAPLAVAFQDQSQAASGRITKWAWAFGDGGTSTQASPSHPYGSGSWTPTLIVTDDHGTESRMFIGQTIEVKQANQRPTPSPTPSPTPTPTPTR